MKHKSGWVLVITVPLAVLILVYLLAGPAIRLALVHKMEDVTGAEVNLSGVSLRFFPFGMELGELQLTDPAQPEQNSLSFASASANIELWPALRGYYVVPELDITGLQYGATRNSPGEVYRQPDVSPKLDLASIMQIDLPSADELIARANLKTPATAERLQQLAKAERQQLKNLAKQLPDKETLARFEAEIKALTEGKINNAADLAARTEQLQHIKAQLKQPQTALKQLTEQLSQSKHALQQAMAELKQASETDWQHLQQLANLKDGGLVSISQILLGDNVAAQISKLESLYQLAQPYLQQSGEAKPATPPDQPYPDFWVKQATVNWLVGGGQTNFTVHDITAQHQLINNNPTRFLVEVSQLPQLQALTINGDFAVLEQMITNVNWQLDGLNLQSFSLGNAENLLKLTSGSVSSTGKLNLIDKQIAQQATVQLLQPDFSASGNKYLLKLVDILNQQAQIPLKLSASGLINQPKISISSSLDSMLGDALLGEAKAKAAELETTLRSRLNTQLQAALADQQQWSDLLSSQTNTAEGLEQQIAALLQTQMTDAKEQVKDKLKDKLLNQLGGG